MSTRVDVEVNTHWYEEILKKHVEYRTTLGIYLVEQILQPNRSNCPHSGSEVSGSKLVSELFLEDPKLAGDLYNWYRKRPIFKGRFLVNDHTMKCLLNYY